MKQDEKAVVAVSLVAVVLVAGVFILLPNIFACLGQSCLGSGGPNPVTGTQNVYFAISTTSGFLTYNVGGQVLPSAGTTGEIVKSCQWFTCALTGVQTTDTIVVSGPKVFSETWTFKLGFGADKEEYVWLASALPAGAYTVTVTAQEAGAIQTATATGTFTVPLSNAVSLSGG